MKLQGVGKSVIMWFQTAQLGQGLMNPRDLEWQIDAIRIRSEISFGPALLGQSVRINWGLVCIPDSTQLEPKSRIEWQACRISARAESGAEKICMIGSIRSRDYSKAVD